ncbi:MAG: hypothetical protein JO288_15580 [Hyphomicrobiales bacterium]|nr:hypothetical protein [Hyphomicrobiales bacterium]
MAQDADNLVLRLLLTMWAENLANLAAFEAGLERVRQGVTDVRVAVTSLELRFDGLDERVEAIREGLASATGFAANGQACALE